MTEHPLLTERLRESIEARRLADPRIEAMVADVRSIRTEVRGLNAIGNLALGNSRESVETANSVFAMVAIMEERLTRLEERIDNMAQWAKGMGKK